MFQKVFDIKKIKGERGGGGEYQDFRRKIVVSQYRKVSQGNLLVLHYFRKSKKFMPTTGVSRFFKKYCRLIVPKNFVGEHFCL